MQSKRPVYILSAIGLLLVAIMLIQFQFFEKVNRFVARENKDYYILNDYEYTTYEDANAPLGIVQEYRWTLTTPPLPNSYLAFYLIHQYAEIYIGDDLVFRLMKDSDNSFSQTIGSDWAKTLLYESDVNKQIRILIYPVYKSSIDKSLTIYYGNLHSVVVDILDTNFYTIIFGILAIIIGSAFIIFVLINLKNHEMDKSIAALGCFSIFTGAWKISDSELMPLLFEDATLSFSAIANISITMMLIAFITFLRNQFSKNAYKIWNVMCILTLAFGIVICILQLLGIADVRSTLSYCHVIVVVNIVGIFVTLFWEGFRHRLTPKLKMTSICFLLCSIGAIIDLILYYVSGASGNMMLCLFAFLIYVIIMGYMAVKETLTLIKRGKEAKKYQHLAIHDQLTGLYNRVFWAEYTQEHKYDEGTSFIIMLDVNNLKHCNDTFGHDIGDKLLTNSADLMNKAFLPNGIPIRMGGDEFCIVLNETLESTCKSYIRHFLSSIEHFNKEHPEEFPIELAYGYAKYNPKVDFDISDALRRADKNMYQKKLEMKTIH